MKKLLMPLMAILMASALIGCGDYDGDEQLDSTTVNVSNEGDGDVTVNTGAGTIVLNSDGQCLVAIQGQDSRACTVDEVEEALETMDTSYVAAAKIL